ncbi:MAG: hypothetical protein JW912_05325, partial [Sedimentisphaerales bacterium]|nr:hypothetical protein [Sedimentisphaerales bacterium]
MKQRTTVIVIFSLLIVFFCVLIFRLVHLQLKPHEAALKTRQQYAVLKEKPQRGVIVDSRSRILAAS